MAKNDLGKVTLQGFLEKKLGTEKAGRVLKHINDGADKGKKGKDLAEHAKEALAKEGHAPGSTESDVVYGLIFVFL
ncbi:MAG: hypothetical protein GY757_47300 [bacterium]|nr:hypothetical protein [bacterium]